jgi:hypothetical protein
MIEGPEPPELVHATLRLFPLTRTATSEFSHATTTVDPFVLG